MFGSRRCFLNPAKIRVREVVMRVGGSSGNLRFVMKDFGSGPLRAGCGACIAFMSSGSQRSRAHSCSAEWVSGCHRKAK